MCLDNEFRVFCFGERNDVQYWHANRNLPSFVWSMLGTALIPLLHERFKKSDWLQSLSSIHVSDGRTISRNWPPRHFASSMSSLHADLPPLRKKNMVFWGNLSDFVPTCFQLRDLDYFHWASAHCHIPRQKEPWMLRYVHISRLLSPGKRFLKKSIMWCGYKARKAFTVPCCSNVKRRHGLIRHMHNCLELMSINFQLSS